MVGLDHVPEYRVDLIYRYIEKYMKLHNLTDP